LSSGQGADTNPLGRYIIVICLLFGHVFIYIADVGELIAERF
jgi:hypothetical protein